MDPSEINAQLDAHDALVRECVEGRLAFLEFLVARGDFPGVGGLEARTEFGMFRRRLAFHRRVGGVISGLHATADLGSLTAEIAEFMPRVGLMRLRELVARYPGFEVPGETVEKRVAP